MKDGCIQGIENKTRIDNLYALLQENKQDFKADIAEMKNTVHDLSAMVTRIAISVFVSVLAVLANVIVTLWLK